MTTDNRFRVMLALVQYHIDLGVAADDGDRIRAAANFADKVDSLYQVPTADKARTVAAELERQAAERGEPIILASKFPFPGNDPDYSACKVVRVNSGHAYTKDSACPVCDSASGLACKFFAINEVRKVLKP